MNSLDKKMFATKTDVQETLVTEKGKRKAITSGKTTNAKNIKATGTNDVKCDKMDSSLKVHFSCDLERTGNETANIMFHFGAQKKMWYGWKRTSREFYFTVDDNRFSIRTGTSTMSDDNSFVCQVTGTNLYGLTCTRCRNEKRPKFCDIGSETFPVAVTWAGMLPFSKEFRYRAEARGKVTIWMMCHGEKFKEDEIPAKVKEGFFDNYPCVVCNIDKSIAWWVDR